MNKYLKLKQAAEPRQRLFRQWQAANRTLLEKQGLSIAQQHIVFQQQYEATQVKEDQARQKRIWSPPAPGSEATTLPAEEAKDEST